MIEARYFKNWSFDFLKIYALRCKCVSRNVGYGLLKIAVGEEQVYYLIIIIIFLNKDGLNSQFNVGLGYNDVVVDVELNVQINQGEGIIFNDESLYRK